MNNQRGEKVLDFLSVDEIRKIIDPTADKVIHYLLKKVAFSQPEVLDEKYLGGIQITKEFLEAWIAQACGLKKVGAGNYPIDVFLENTYGADVKFVTAKINSSGSLAKTQSNETSLGQNFADAGSDLDQMFEANRYDDILNKWILILQNKFDKPINKLGVKIIYYFIFIRGKNKIYLSIAKVNASVASSLKVRKGGKTSIHIDNFLDDKYGKVKIYKSKKRMELRMFPKNLEEDNLTVSWNFAELHPSVINLRDLVESGNIKEHVASEVNKFFS